MARGMSGQASASRGASPGFGAVSPDYGLAYASGVDLERVYRAYGYVVERRLWTGPIWCT